jgi:DNA-directed RNA polymerase subunit RPC12/RpoP
MNIFKKLTRSEASKEPEPGGISADLPRVGDLLPASLKAHSRFIKRVSCSQCGAPKSLPSATAYIYCDYCGALMDYDFRLANADTNAGLTNTVFHRLIATVQAPLSQAIARGDRDACREIYRQVFSQWIQECPMAVSPRARNDLVFREQLIAYFAESAVTKDLDPRQTELNARMDALVTTLQRIPTPGGAWQVAGGFWPYAELFKHQMELTYALMHETGVDALDPDKAPPGVALRMEYTTFCQAWLPHLSAADGEKVLKLYGLNGEYDEVKPQQTNHYKCGMCGSEIETVPGARQVVCENCGFTIDVGSEAVSCRKCGSLLSLPISASHVICPYCSTDTRRI